MTTPVLRDPTGRYVITPRAKGPVDTTLKLIGATQLLYGRGGVRRGVYVDNETPNRADVAERMVLEHVGIVVVGLYPDEEKLRFPGCIATYELYRWQDYGIFSIPRCQGYIVQRFYAPPGDQPPTLAQTRRLTAKAWTRLPRLVWWY